MSDINSPATPAAQDSPASARLEAGQTAPDFTLPSDEGDSITLSSLRGQNIILYFYPAAMTPAALPKPATSGTTSHASPPADSPYSAYRRIRWTGSSDSASAII